MYVTDALMVISENTQYMFGGRVMGTRYIDLLNDHEEEKSADEIAIDVIKRAGLKVNGRI